ncbi:LysR substrate-binding domain-containing protein [Clostridium sp. YIM B02555]|uniref:LysR substrate-binding domain-containing protein n=1 Tax=Clostridium sp. YIM B02555 TaxID=2911968 RepID=UPI0023AF79E7|nr:LysR substrate-binding domain-containing protein [Clostridium sp. YIM B02555]
MYRISFQQIHYFLVMAEVLNFTEASKLLYISQPALSKQIQILEKELGVSLFIRNNQSVALTPSGKFLFEEWSCLEDKLNSSISNAKSLSHSCSGSLNIGSTETFECEESILEIVDSFRINYPNINVNLELYGFRSLREKLNSKELDIIFVPYFELASYKDIEFVHFQEVNIAIAVPTSNPLSKLDNVTIKDLTDQPFVVISSDESANGVETIKNTCRLNGFSPNIVKYTKNMNSLILAVKNGEGVTFCNNKIPVDKKIRLYEYQNPLKDSDIYAVWKKNNSKLELNFLKNELLKLNEN